MLGHLACLGVGDQEGGGGGAGHGVLEIGVAAQRARDHEVRVECGHEWEVEPDARPRVADLLQLAKTGGRRKKVSLR